MIDHEFERDIAHHEDEIERQERRDRAESPALFERIDPLYEALQHIAQRASEPEIVRIATDALKKWGPLYADWDDLLERAIR